MASDPIRFTLDGLEDDPGALDVLSLDLAEGLSERTRAEVVVASREVLDLAPKLGGPAVLAAQGAIERMWSLRLASVKYLGVHHGLHRTRVRLEDPLLPLRHRLTTRKWRGGAVEAIAAAVLEEHAIPARFAVEPSPARSYCVQYRETDLDFVTRLLAAEGFFFWFEPDGTVVVRDRSEAGEPLRDGAVFPLVESGGALTDALPSIHALRRGARNTTKAVTLGDRDWQRPDLLLREVASGDGDAMLEQYDFPGGFREPDRGARLALHRAQALTAEARYLGGESGAVDLRPGAIFQVDASLPGALGGAWLLVRVRHAWTSAGRYENAFQAIPATQPFRPPSPEAAPRIAGHHTAFVRGPEGEDIHTDAFGRFKAQMHWDRDAQSTDADSRWLRMLQETSSSMVLARTGWEVYVGFLDGDPDRPFGLGRAIDGGAPPTYGLPASQTKMTVWTPSSPATGGYSEVSLDDAGGSQGFHMRAEKDYEGVVENDRAQTIGNDEQRQIGSDQKLTVKGARVTQVGANETVTDGATSERSVAGDRTVTIGGSESLDVGAAISETATLADSEKVGSVRASIVGSLAAPSFKKMAKQALAGLVPAPIRQIQALAQDPGASLRGFLGGLATGAANAAGAALVGGTSASAAAGDAIEQGARSQVALLTGVPAGAPGPDGKIPPATQWLPTVEQLRAQYSAKAIGTQLSSAVSSATGGLSDLVTGNGQGDKSSLSFGWAQADKLIDLFSVGGIERGASIASRRMVGGAQIEAALGPIEWGSSGLWLETVGGVKLTKAANDIKQEVRGLLKTTVLGPVLRSAGVAIQHTVVLLDSITALTAMTLTSAANINLTSVGALSVKADSAVLSAGDGASSIELGAGSAVFATGKLNIKASGSCVIKSAATTVTTGG